jgi:2,4-dienoyl-CoA reductase-like NADH-dependent reductase (Old Yellow Enzyme family)
LHRSRVILSRKPQSLHSGKLLGRGVVWIILAHTVQPSLCPHNAGGWYDAPKGESALDAGIADAISFGRLFIANPDLPERFARGLALANSDPATWYSKGTEGYTDFAKDNQI